MRWQVKCVVDSCKSLFPFQKQLRALKGSVCPSAPGGPDEWNTIRQGLLQVEWLQAVRPVGGLSMMEIGSGWQPIIPVLFSLAGAARVYLTDLNPLCRPDTFAAALAGIRSHKRAIVEALSIPGTEFDRAVRAGGDLGERLRELRLEYLAPCDCRRTGLPASSLDVITSRAVFEHIPPDVIRDILRESLRLLKPGGLICHIVDNSDHWEHRDKTISRVNFLKFPDAAFRWTHINSLNYQNRLRHSEYVAMVRDAGFEALRMESEVDAGALAALPSMRLAPRFRGFAPEDLAATTSYLLAARPAAKAAAV